MFRNFFFFWVENIQKTYIIMKTKKEKKDMTRSIEVVSADGRNYSIVFAIFIFHLSELYTHTVLSKVAIFIFHLSEPYTHIYLSA